MTAKDIQDKLCKKFENNKYTLLNSYIFDWECDYFSMTSSNYFIEGEIKLSYSDFKADFRKENKHRDLKAKYEGKDILTLQSGKTYDYSYEQTTSLLIDGKRVYDEETKSYKQVGTGKRIKSKITMSSKEIEYYLKDKLNVEYKEISTNIIFKKLIVPNKFFYICPKGIIPKEEVPEYAGLYYIDENNRMTEIKRTPFIHKEQLNLDKVLLDKFYWKSIGLEKNIKL